MSRSTNIGRLTRPGAVYNQREMEQLINQIEKTLIILSVIIQEGYSTSNVTTTRIFDADATTLAELADVVGTLIEDMKAKGYLGG